MHVVHGVVGHVVHAIAGYIFLRKISKSFSQKLKTFLSVRITLIFLSVRFTLNQVFKCINNT